MKKVLAILLAALILGGMMGIGAGAAPGMREAQPQAALPEAVKQDLTDDQWNQLNDAYRKAYKKYWTDDCFKVHETIAVIVNNPLALKGEDDTAVLEALVRVDVARTRAAEDWEAFRRNDAAVVAAINNGTLEEEVDALLAVYYPGDMYRAILAEYFKPEAAAAAIAWTTLTKLHFEVWAAGLPSDVEGTVVNAILELRSEIDSQYGPLMDAGNFVEASALVDQQLAKADELLKPYGIDSAAPVLTPAQKEQLWKAQIKMERKFVETMGLQREYILLAGLYDTIDIDAFKADKTLEDLKDAAEVIESKADEALKQLRLFVANRYKVVDAINAGTLETDIEALYKAALDPMAAELKALIEEYFLPEAIAAIQPYINTVMAVNYAEYAREAGEIDNEQLEEFLGTLDEYDAAYSEWSDLMAEGKWAEAAAKAKSLEETVLKAAEDAGIVLPDFITGETTDEDKDEDKDEDEDKDDGKKETWWTKMHIALKIFLGIITLGIVPLIGWLTSK
ncbi:MAG: hypothetical protein LBG83_03910 [Oscillospiraceae bacterium]|nr:hypothetical protein [Oscillospiraceae bacterium]